jgi:hypothetical protein
MKLLPTPFGRILRVGVGVHTSDLPGCVHVAGLWALPKKRAKPSYPDVWEEVAGKRAKP